jgi:hypothetical protein
MTEISRRTLFRLAAGAAAVAALPASAAVIHAPMIYCDGKHDDAPGVNALIAGEPVHFANPELAEGIGWDGTTLHLRGEFHMERGLRIRGLGRVTIDGGDFTHYHSGPYIIASECDYVFVQNQRHLGGARISPADAAERGCILVNPT